MAEVGSVFVNFRANATSFLRGTKNVSNGLRGVGREAVFSTRNIARLVTTVGGFLLVARGFQQLKQAVVGTNIELRRSAIQFEVLLSSAEEAQKVVQGLFKFAAKTPFEVAPITEAAKTLLSFGTSAEELNETLRLVGDAAAVTTGDIQGLAFWFGRAMSAIESGRPFGEAAQRLQELAILTPEARNKLEELQESGASSTEIFKVFREEFARFGGGMTKLSGEWEGLTSTIIDNTRLALAQGFEPLFNALRELLRRLAEIVQSRSFQVWVREFARATIDLGRKLAIGTAKVIDELRRVARDAIRVGSTMIEWVQGLPQWVKTGGIIGAVVFGLARGSLLVRGITAALTVASLFFETTQTKVERLGKAVADELGKPLEEVMNMSNEAIAAAGQAAIAEINELEAGGIDTVGAAKVLDAKIAEFLSVREELNQIQKDGIAANLQRALDKLSRGGLDVQATITKGFTGGGTQSIDKLLVGLLEKNFPKFKELNRDLDEELQLIEARFKVTGEAQDELRSKTDAYTEALVRLNAAGLGQTKIARAWGEELETLKEKLKLSDAIDTIADSISGALQQTVIGIQRGTQTIGEAFRNLAQNILASITQIVLKVAVFEPLERMIRKFLNSLLEAQSATGGSAGGIGGLLGGFGSFAGLQNFFNLGSPIIGAAAATATGGAPLIGQGLTSIPNIVSFLPLAEGGITTRPIVGEAGPEAIIPLDRISDVMGRISADGSSGEAAPRPDVKVFFNGDIVDPRAFRNSDEEILTVVVNGYEYHAGLRDAHARENRRGRGF